MAADDVAIRLRLQDQAKVSAGLHDVTEDVGKVGEEAKSTGKDAGKLAAGMKDATSEMEDASSEAKGLRGQLKGLAGAAAGIGAGVAGGVGLGAVLGMESTNDLLAAQLGVTGQRAGEVGDIAGRLFATNYADSLDGASELVRGTIQGLGTDLSDSQVELFAGFSANLEAAGFADVNEATRAASSLVKNGLAGSFTEAFDIITKGFTGTANKSDDFLESLFTYAPAMKSLGLDAADFTGMMEDSFENGAISTDLMGDALKEFTILAQDGSAGASFKAMGLPMKELSNDIAAGGDRARGAFGEIMDGLRRIDDPLKQRRAGIGLFGSMWEDAGADVILGMTPATDALGDFNGAAEQMGITLSGNPTAKVKAFRQNVENEIVNFLGDTAIPAIENAAASLDSWGVNKEGITSTFDGLKSSLGLSAEDAVRLGDAVHNVGTWAQWVGDTALPPFVDTVEGTFGFLGGVVDIFSSALTGDIGGAIDGVGTMFTGMFDTASSAFLTFTAPIRAAWGEVLDWVLGKVDEIIGKLDSAKSKLNPLDGGFGKGVGDVLGIDLTPGFNLPGFASGGNIAGSGSFWVGERGPELATKNGANLRISPLSSVPGPSLPSGTGGGGSGGSQKTVYLLLHPDGRRVIGELLDDRDDRRDARRP